MSPKSPLSVKSFFPINTLISEERYVPRRSLQATVPIHSIIVRHPIGETILIALRSRVCAMATAQIRTS